MSALFSIIIPIYNVEKYLPQCLDSVLGQTFSDIEVILVDDGSTDDCPRMCDGYASRDERIKVIHKQNGGIVSARQAGTAEAAGEYIINVDADDWIDTAYCEKMAEVIGKFGPDIVMCGHVKTYEEKEEPRPLTNRAGFYDREQIEKEILPGLLQNEYAKGMSLSLWAKAIKRPLQRKHQLTDVALSMGEDSACVAPCIFHAQSLYVMEDCLYYYRQNPESITKSRKVLGWDGPGIRGRHLEEHMDMGFGDLRQQVKRGVTHSLFSVVKSQFNRTDAGSGEIKKDIREHLRDPYYSEAINESSFKGLKANLMKYSLKYRWLWMIKLFSKI